MEYLTERIIAFNKNSPPWLVKLKYKAMAESAFRFFRGTCHLYYQDLSTQKSELPETPRVWVCGDLHLENFGSFKGNNRMVYFDLNDFDEGILAPLSWELSRMLTSIFVGFESWEIETGEATALAKLFVDQYCKTLTLGKAKSIEPRTAKGIINTFLKVAAGRDQSLLLEKLTVKSKKGFAFSTNGTTRFPIEDKKLKNELIQFIADWHKKNPDWENDYDIMDVVIRVAGTGSIGLKRYLFLMRKKSNKEKFLFAEMKQARTSALAPYIKIKQPVWDATAERTIAIQQRMQYTSPAFLDWVTFQDETYTFKEMQPTADAIQFDLIKTELKKVRRVIKDMATLTAYAQLRSGGRQGSAIADELIAFGGKDNWQNALLKYASTYTKTVQVDYKIFFEAWKKNPLLSGNV